jgi:hypothetical protein
LVFVADRVGEGVVDVPGCVNADARVVVAMVIVLEEGVAELAGGLKVGEVAGEDRLVLECLEL